MRTSRRRAECINPGYINFGRFMPSRPNCEWQTQQIRIAFRFGPRVTHAYFTCDFHTDHLKLSSRKPGICNPSYFEVSGGDLLARMASRCACRHRELTTGAPLPGLPTQSGRYLLDSDVLVEVRGLRPNLRRRRPSLVLSRSPQQLATPETVSYTHLTLPTILLV